MPEITVIVPVYKVEPYLVQCIDSILAQTFSDFEVILVDDGSPDRCGEICEAYQLKDKRISVIHKKNGGLSDARNTALDRMKGRYVTFVDSDDYIAPKMLENTYRLIKQYNADIVMNAYYNVDRDGRKIKNYNGSCFNILNSKQAIRTVLEMKKTSVIACAKLYSRNVYDKIRFPVGKTAEDAFVIVKVLEQADTIIYDSNAYYYYVARADSITNQEYHKNFDEIEAYRNNFDLVKEKYPTLKKYVRFRYFVAINSVLRKMMDAKLEFRDPDFQMLRKIIFKNIMEVMLLPSMGWKRKVMMAILAIVPKVYYKIETNRKF